MRLWSRKAALAISAVALAGLIGFAFASRAAAQGQAAPKAATKTPAASKAGKAATTKGVTAAEYFNNVTTASLGALSVDDFIGSMGVIAAALGYDCADCHPGAGSDRVNWVTDSNPKKVMARKMINMVAGINRTYFNGAQNVTCFTCHHGRDLPSTSIALDKLYGPPNDEHTDVIEPGQGVPTIDQVLSKYIQALGGAQRLAGLNSWIATGTSLGYEGLGGGGTFQIIAKRPNQRTTLIQFKEHPERGDNTRVFDGRNGWIKSPRGLLSEYELTGTELDGARLDAQLSFPDQMKTALTNWKVGALESLGDKDVQVVQGSGPRGLLATFYFDKDSGLLLREVRYGTSPIGRNPTQMDFSDYREVNGIKFPFKYTFSWLDGRDSFQITDVKVNPAIDASKFAKP
ncbi:MAG TPA: photosynthetic reaction center cytochrome c subunit family protein [Bryobacteraceae bacterium]|nr:photosynthetic reaction center cytochrome c subunit family protein [Bryobacteraceae bacterium]